MSKQEVEEKIIKLAHEFSAKYGEDVLHLKVDELIMYLSSYFDYESWLIFKHNQYEMIKLFVETVKQDLNSLNK